MRVARGTLVGLFVLMTLCASVMPAAAGKIYFSRDPFPGAAVQRANLDGSNVETLQETTSFAVALDLVARKIYWGDIGAESASIRRANLNGSAAQTVVELFGLSPHGLAVDHDAGRLYASLSFFEGCIGILRYRLDGTGKEFIVNGVCVGGLALDPTRDHLYWAQTEPDPGIWRASLAGSNPLRVVETTSRPHQLALDRGRGKIYWTESEGNVLRADFDGSNIELLVDSEAFVEGVALDLQEQKMYWGERFTGGVILRANLDGSDPEPILELGTVGSLAIDVAGGVDVPATSRTGLIATVLLFLGLSVVVILRRSSS